jgi:hypothetical protein
MTTTLSAIRFLIEQQSEPTTNEDVIIWCNEVNMDVGMNIDIPATPQTIVLDVNTLNYPLSANLKIINRLRLQSDITAGIDLSLNIKYRIYNGEIIIPNVFWVAPDSLVVDYYKHMSYFTAITEAIDIADRFTPLYTFYGLSKSKPEFEPKYQMMKDQVVSYYSLGNEPVTIESRWRG